MKAMTYRDLLREELSHRVSKNPGYSLRAFSRDIGVEPGQLSRVLNEKKNLSLHHAHEVAERLFENSRKRKHFLALVELALSKKPSARKMALEKAAALSPPPARLAVELQIDAMRVISDWYHVAILDLTAVKGFESSYGFLSSTLGISEIEAKLAVERLMKLGLLSNENGKWRKTHARLATPDGMPSHGIREFHKQMIQKGVAAIEEQPVEKRYLRAKTMALRAGDYEKLLKLIDRFLETAGELCRKDEAPREELYQLNLQLFSLIKRRKK